MQTRAPSSAVIPHACTSVVNNKQGSNSNCKNAAPLSTNIGGCNVIVDTEICNTANPAINCVSSSEPKSSVQHYNGIQSSEGLRLRAGANKHEKRSKSKPERTGSTEMVHLPPIGEGANNTISDPERTTGLKGITVFRGHVPSGNSEMQFIHDNGPAEHIDRRRISQTNMPLDNATSNCAITANDSALADGHIIHYGDEHVESYL